MKNLTSKYPRILAIAPSTRGFGFALIEGQDTLVDWGVTTVKGDKNAKSLERIKKMIAEHEPEVIVLEDASSKGVRRSARIQTLTKQIAAMSKTLHVRVQLLAREKVRRLFFADGKGTKHGLALVVAQSFPDELAFRLPPKRKAWMSEHYRMGIFDAVALALAFRRIFAKPLPR